MAFGNPYGDPWNIGEVVDAVDLLESLGVRTISLADTVGLAGPAQIRELVSAVNSKFDYLEIGVHLHSRPEQAAEKILAAYDAGCRRFDSALGGLGGCPFAQDALVGNIPTEKVVEALRQSGAELPALEVAGCVAADYGGDRGALHRVRGCRLRRDHMEFKTIQLAFDSGVATITLNRPEKRNAISHVLVDELLAALDEIERSPAPGRHPHRRGQGFLRRHGPRRTEDPAGQNA